MTDHLITTNKKMWFFYCSLNRYLKLLQIIVNVRLVSFTFVKSLKLARPWTVYNSITSYNKSEGNYVYIAVSVRGKTICWRREQDSLPLVFSTPTQQLQVFILYNRCITRYWTEFMMLTEWRENRQCCHLSSHLELFFRPLFKCQWIG